MDRRKDYSDYQPTKAQRYYAQRRDSKYLSLHCFHNLVRFWPDSQSLHISVDATWEEPMVREELEDRAVMEDLRRRNEETLSRFQSRFTIERTFTPSETEEPGEEDTENAPLNNVLSGAEITLHYGEGLLDFLYADFSSAFAESMETDPIIALLRQASDWDRTEKARMGQLQDEPPEKIYNQKQELAERYFRYVTTQMEVWKEANLSLYTAICPPIFADERHADLSRKRYRDYLLALQREYLELLEFCFDEQFYPELLADLHPAERYVLCRRANGYPMPAKRTETVSFSVSRMSGRRMPYGAETGELLRRLQREDWPEELIDRFASRYGMTAETVRAILRFPHFLHVGYTFSSVDEILQLEFTKLLESNVRFRKCRRCGRYFIRKGNYDTRYCDRVPEGETRTCQELAAQENYRRKAEGQPALAIYDRYYRRYAARVRVRQIREADFKQWRYQAMTMRDRCIAGELPLQDFADWMEASFPNRKKREN